MAKKNNPSALRLALTLWIDLPSASRASTSADNSGRSVRVRMFSTFRAPDAAFGAARRDRVDQFRSPVERRAIAVAHAVADAVELHRHDLADDRSGKREIRHQGHASEKGRLEELRQFRPQRVGKSGGIRRRFGVGEQLVDQIRTSVAGHDDDGVLEIDVAAFAVLHVALVEDRSRTRPERPGGPSPSRRAARRCRAVGGRPRSARRPRRSRHSRAGCPSAG